MEKTRFSFDSRTFILAEIITDKKIEMYWETNRELCPHCKEIIIKGQHHILDTIQFWLPEGLSEESCILKDLVILGKNESTTLLLTKDKIKEALEFSEKFKRLVE